MHLLLDYQQYSLHKWQEKNYFKFSMKPQNDPE